MMTWRRFLENRLVLCECYGLNELDSDFEEDEVEDEEVDEEDKGQMSAICCFCCTLGMVESLVYNLYRNVNFIYV